MAIATVIVPGFTVVVTTPSRRSVVTDAVTDPATIATVAIAVIALRIVPAIEIVIAIAVIVVVFFAVEVLTPERVGMITPAVPNERAIPIFAVAVDTYVRGNSVATAAVSCVVVVLCAIEMLAIDGFIVIADTVADPAAIAGLALAVHAVIVYITVATIVVEVSTVVVPV